MDRSELEVDRPANERRVDGELERRGASNERERG